MLLIFILFNTIDKFIYVVDYNALNLENEIESINELRKFDKEIILIINKDDNFQNSLNYKFFSIKNIFFISCSHKLGFYELYEFLETFDDKLESFIDNQFSIAIFGEPNAGKSTLANVIAGNEEYEVNSGKIIFKDHNLLDLNIEERSQLGIFLAFQYPVEIPGVNITPFLKASLNAKLKKQGKDEVDALSFAQNLKKTATELGIASDMLSRSVNEGFSGGEKKRYEILQMSILNPSLAILDETDSGLDVDAFKTITKGVNKIKNKNNSFLIITHYEKLLENIVPNFIHIMKAGKIIKTGDKTLAKQIEKEGFQSF